MKILKIELQNINSLKSDVAIEIDFENPRFQDVGLFAITGPTGAGKTTLLDAITIALYRRVPRFEKSGGKGGLEDVISYGATSAMARVTFEAQQKRYEAQWDMRLASNNGKRLSKPVETVRLKNLSTAEIVAETKTTCDEKIIEITQLNYDQFLRSVMLAQGEFAAFLSARNTEKGLLLQQIAGDEIYRKIGENLKNRIFAEKKLLEQITNKINNDDLLKEEIIEELKEEELQLGGSLKVLMVELKKTDDLVKRYEQINKFKLQKLNNEANKAQLNIDIEQNSFVYQQLEKHEAAEPFKATLTDIIRSEQDIEKKKNRNQAISAELIIVDEKLKDFVLLETSCKTKTSEIELLNADWQPKLEKVIEYDTKIQTHKKSIEEHRNSIKELTSITEIILKKVENKTAELRLQQANLSQLRVFFEQNKNIPAIEKQMSSWNMQLTNRKSNWDRMSVLKTEIDKYKAELAGNKIRIDEINSENNSKKKSLGLINAEIADLQKLLAKDDIENLLLQGSALNTKKELLRDLIQWSVNYNQLSVDQKLSTEQKVSLEQKQKELIEHIKQFEAKVAIAILSEKDAAELYEKDQYIVSLEAERKKLKQGEPCALCGSSTHPLVEKYTEIIVSDSKKRLDERKAILEQLKKDKNTAELQQARTVTELQQVMTQISKRTLELEELSQKFVNVGSEHKIGNKETIEIALKTVEAEQNILSKKISDFQELQKNRDKKQSDLKIIDDAIKSFDLQLAQLTTANLEIEKTVINNEKEFNTLNISIQDLEKELVSQFADCEIELPETENTVRFIQKLEANVKAYNDNIKKNTDIVNAVEQCNIEIKSQNDQIVTKTKEINAIADKIADLNKDFLEISDARKEILPLEISTDQKRKELQANSDLAKKAFDEAAKKLSTLRETRTVLSSEQKSIQKELLEIEATLRDLLVALNLKINESSFSNREELSAALLTDDLKNKYLQIRKDIETRKIEMITLEKNIEAELESLEKELKLDETLEEAMEKKLQLNEQKDTFQKRKGQISESFRKDAEIRSRNAQLVAEIKQQEKVCRKWMALMNVLGGSQDAFNTYVQRLTLKSLIDLANLHLYKLNRRYSLQLNSEYKVGEELNFKVVDHYQADEMRLVDTSSGGEKFLISLALALGLSDLASNNVSIGSLFIDEGFGTLDSNTLETVISTLETLKAQDKLIGIISHVDSLKERIPVQIQVIKKSNGISYVELN